MVRGTNTEHTPSAGLVVPHYVFAAVTFLALTILLNLSPDSLTGHFFNPRLLAITHLAVLGWGSMVAFGALYQLIPVILHVPLYSERLGKVTFFLLAAGTLLLAFCFWTFSMGHLLHVAAFVVTIAILLFSINLFTTASRSKNWKIEADCIATSSIWLLLTAVLGSLMAFNFSMVFLPEDHLHYLKIHAHTGFVGWFLLLIIGVGSRLVPMFLLAHQLNRKKITWAYTLVNIGLVMLVVNWLFFPQINLLFLHVVLLAGGVLFFLSYIIEAYRKRLRKVLDAGMKQSMIAFVFLLASVLTGVLFGTSGNRIEISVTSYLVYGLIIVLGFISALIMGQTYKTLPFIVWLHRFGKQGGGQKFPMPKDMFSSRVAYVQMLFLCTGIIVLSTGVLSGERLIIYPGNAMILIAAICYNYNVFRIIGFWIKSRSCNLTKINTLTNSSSLRA